jgi:hypothetical protein
MTNPAVSSRKLCVAYDVAGYSRLSARSQVATQGRLARMLDVAFGGAGLPDERYEILDQGDGGVAILTPGQGADEPRLVASLINELETGLTQLNKNLTPDAKVRLRVSMAEGIIGRTTTGFTGAVIIQACRLRDSDALRSALAAAKSHLAVALTDALYRDTQGNLPGHLEFERTEFSLKGMTGIAWVYPTPNPAHKVGWAALLGRAEEQYPPSHTAHTHESQSLTAATHVYGLHTVHEYEDVDSRHPDHDVDPGDHDAHHPDYADPSDHGAYHSDPDPW